MAIDYKPFNYFLKDDTYPKGFIPNNSNKKGTCSSHKKLLDEFFDISYVLEIMFSEKENSFGIT
ncbi:hypothetical protein CR513_36141, partial [Mucuna pruriens]